MATDPRSLKTSPSLEEEDLEATSGRHERANIMSSPQKLPKIEMSPDFKETLDKQNGEEKTRRVQSIEGDLFHDQHHNPPAHHQEHLPSTQNLSVPLPGSRIRRRSAPSMLEPIQEGLLGTSNRRNSGPGGALVTADKKERFQQLLEIHNAPLGPKNSSSSILSKRRCSDPIGLFQSDDKLKMFSFEARYPAPRRNSLVSATLDELTSQFELLDRRKRVVEESELLETDVSINPPILITDS